MWIQPIFLKRGNRYCVLKYPAALKFLRRQQYSANQLRTKSRNEVTGIDAPNIDFVFKVCDNATDETCPVWSEWPVAAHWDCADPSVSRAH